MQGYNFGNGYISWAKTNYGGYSYANAVEFSDVYTRQMFDVSVDEYIFPDTEVKKSSVRSRLDAQLDTLDDKELSVIEATVIGLCKAKEPEAVSYTHLVCSSTPCTILLMPIL